MSQDRLEIKVRARNRANQISNELAPKILAALAPFVGQKVILASGELSAKLRAALAPFRQNTIPVSAWVDSGRGYALVLKVKTCEPGPRSCSYMERTTYLADIQGDTLAKLLDLPEPLRTDYTAAEVLAMRETKKKAEAALTAARHPLEMNDFGDHDAH